ncbi:MAG: hypothetical protein SYC29_00515, partial [Planctomycetota bacterium]|nr:hypothetical protein [Planctomycetota bacterium]
QQIVDGVSGLGVPPGGSDGYSCPLVWSRMLTVWRRVWLELDSMGPGEDIWLSGSIDSPVKTLFFRPVWRGACRVVGRRMM